MTSWIGQACTRRTLRPKQRSSYQNEACSEIEKLQAEKEEMRKQGKAEKEETRKRHELGLAEKNSTRPG